MKTYFAVGLFILMLATSVGFAQAGPGQGQRGRRYDPSTETTMKGTVAAVTQQAGRNGWNGTHLTLKTDDTAIQVHVGPSAYLEQQHFTFANGDQIEVTGSKVKMGGQDVLIAREIKKDGKVLKLRDAQGIPLWAGRGRQPAS
jgi:hypothetical protein